MSKRLIALLSIVLLVAFVGTVGCKNKTQPETTPPPVETPPPPPEEPPEVEVPADDDFEEEPEVDVETLDERIARLQRQLRTVYFDYDKSDLKEAARSALDNNAAVLAANSDLNVVIEGHCDERGTIEYNIALGDRRANAARDYLASLGIALDRMRVVSYGEERPAVAGSGESAWAKNRRAEFALEQ